MPSDDENLTERLRQFPATAESVGSAPIDLSDPTNVDEVSQHLLRRFSAVGTAGAVRDEAFALLVEVAAPLLDVAVVRTRRQLGLAIPSSDLVNAHFAEMYVDGVTPGIDVRAFIASSTRRIEGVASEAAAILAGHSIQSTAGAAIAESLGVLERLSPDELSRLSADVLDVYCRAFHSLDLADRQVLVCRSIDELSEADTANELNLALLDVDELCKQALARFAERKNAMLDAGADP